MAILAAVSVLVLLTSLVLGIAALTPFAIWMGALSVLGVYLDSPQLRFGCAAWARNRYVFLCMEILEITERWTLMLHPFPRVRLAKLLWRRLTYLQYGEPTDAFSYTAPILTRRSMKYRYADKLELVGAANMYGDYMPHRGLAVALALVDKYHLSASTVKELSAAVDGPEAVMELLDSGLPAEYVLAMGGVR